MTPTYINILNVYAFCNTHDITWGTKGDDKPEKLPSATTKADGKVDVSIPTDDGDLNAQYEAELRAFATKYSVPKKIPSPSEKQEDYYKGFRSGVVLVWMFCNLALAAVVTNAGMERLTVDNNIQDRANIYMQVVLWSVAGLSAFRFVGAVWFLIVRMVRIAVLLFPKLDGRLTRPYSSVVSKDVLACEMAPFLIITDRFGGIQCTNFVRTFPPDFSVCTPWLASTFA